MMRFAFSQVGDKPVLPELLDQYPEDADIDNAKRSGVLDASWIEVRLRNLKSSFAEGIQFARLATSASKLS